MKAPTHLLALANLFSVACYSQDDTIGTFPASANIVRTSQKTNSVKWNPAFMSVAYDGRAWLDSMDNVLFCRVPRCPNGITLDAVPANYPMFTEDGKPYMGEQYVISQLSDSLFRVMADSIKEKDFCFNDSINAEDGGLDNKIIDFVYNHMGRTVGFGICMDLVREAEEYVDADWYKEKWMNNEKYVVDSSEIQEGDVIDFENVVLDDSTIIEAHIGIVYRVLSDGYISYAEQNVGTVEGGEQKIQYYGRYLSLHKNSNVITSTLQLHDVISGKITFYRF